IAVLAITSSASATDRIWITISGNQGQTNTQAEEFRYSQSPRDLAGGSSSMAAVNAGTGARGAARGRAAMRRTSDPVVIVKPMDESSSFFVNAGANGATFTYVRFEFKRTVGTTTEVYQTVTLTNAIVSSVREINGNGAHPMQEVSFTFQKI